MVSTQWQRSNRCSTVSYWLRQIGQVGVGEDRLLNSTIIVAITLCKVPYMKWPIFGGTSNFQMTFHDHPGTDREEEEWWSLEERDLDCTQRYLDLTVYLSFLLAAHTSLSFLRGSPIGVSLIAVCSSIERNKWRKLMSHSPVIEQIKEHTLSVSNHRNPTGWSKMSFW